MKSYTSREASAIKCQCLPMRVSTNDRAIQPPSHNARTTLLPSHQLLHQLQQHQLLHHLPQHQLPQHQLPQHQLPQHQLPQHQLQQLQLPQHQLPTTARRCIHHCKTAAPTTTPSGVHHSQRPLHPTPSHTHPSPPNWSAVTPPPSGAPAGPARSRRHARASGVAAAGGRGKRGSSSGRWSAIFNYCYYYYYYFFGRRVFGAVVAMTGILFV
jgi:hypothetical protein